MSDSQTQHFVSERFGEGYSVNIEGYEHLNRWTYLDIQLSEARDYLGLSQKSSIYEEIGSINELRLNQALLRSFVTSYSKCFTESAKGKLKLDATVIFKSSERSKEIHEQILAVRHEFVAHNGKSNLVRPYIAVNETSTALNLRKVVASYRNELNYEICSEHLEYVTAAVKERISKCIKNLEKTRGKVVSYK